MDAEAASVAVGVFGAHSPARSLRLDTSILDHTAHRRTPCRDQRRKLLWRGRRGLVALLPDAARNLGVGERAANLTAHPLHDRPGKPVESQAPIDSVTRPLPRFLGPVVQTLTRRLTLKQMPDGRAWVGGGHRAELLGDAIAIAPGESEQNLATAASLFPALGGVSPARSWAAADGYTPDRVSVLGRLRGDGLLHACGFSGHGFQSAPAVGVVVARLAAGAAPDADITGLCPTRFSAARPAA